MQNIDRYLVVGNPIAHSKSPFIHTLFARQTNQQMSYQAQEVPMGGFESAMNDFFASGGKGCNVTAPFKEDAFQFASVLTKRAELAGAVNTLKILDDGGILGDNTDGAGLIQDLMHHHVELKEANVLVVGAGGAARGILLPLLACKPNQIIITNRDQIKADALSASFQHYGNITSSGLSHLRGRQFDLVINATTASCYGVFPQLPENVVKNAIVYDMVYGSDITSSNLWAKKHGALHVIDGLGMLVRQASESFTIWRGVRPCANQVIRELRHNLMR